MSYYYGGYPYSLPLLYNDYKLAGLYNELDELNDVESHYCRDFQMPTDVSMNHGLHMQLKYKNHELVQNMVKKDVEIVELKGLLKSHNIEHPLDDMSMCNMDSSPINLNSTKERYFYPYRPHPYGPYPYGPYPYGPRPYGPYPYGPYLYRGTKIEPKPNTMPAQHMIVPKAFDPNAQPPIIPLPCVLPPVQPPQ